MPWLSVIIPCYNVKEKFLNRCVDSVLAQGIDDYEILLVDDGSDEKYKKIYRIIGEKDKRIKIINQDNKGVSAARNNGLKHAEGEYIVFLDADDAFTDLFFKEAFQLCENGNIEMLIGGTSLMHQLRYQEQKEGEFFECTRLSGEKKTAFKEYLIGDVLHFGNRKGYFGRGPWAKVVKREIVAKVFFDESLKMGEDIIWNIQVLDCCKEVVLAKRIWHLYYVNTESVTHKFNENMLDMIEKEMESLSNVVDFNDVHEMIGYCCHLLDELRKLYDCYLGNCQCTLSFSENRRLRNQLYTSKPWTMINDKKFRDNANIRYKLKSYFYQFRIFFFFLKIRNYIYGNRH